MRQKKVIPVALVVIIVIIAAIAVFALVRKGTDTGGRAEQDHHHEDTASGYEDAQPSGELKEGTRIIKVKARQFEFDPEQIVVKKGEKVRLEVTSQDVTHGINIKAFDINRKLQPEKTEIITFTADKVGKFHFHCSVFCGRGHSDMHGELIIID